MDSPASPAVAAAPDWSVQTEELLCPLCDYNLRGLTEARCPECGYQFEWIKLRDPTQRKHPYLFEHHPERNIGSFLRTMAGSLLPQRFWTLLHPRQPSSPRRLVLYCLLNLLLVLIPSAIMAAPYLYDYAQLMERNRIAYLAAIKANPASFNWINQRYGSVETYMRVTYPRVWGWQSMRNLISRSSRHLPLMTAGFAYLLWPLCGLALFMIFQQSMRRARIRPTHVLRCLIYSADATVLFLAGVVPMLFVFLIHFIHLNELPRTATVYRAMQNIGMIAIPLVWLTATWRMIVAYRRYLQFPHAVGVVVATEVILFLGLFCTLVLILNPTELMRMLRLW